MLSAWQVERYRRDGYLFPLPPSRAAELRAGEPGFGIRPSRRPNSTRQPSNCTITRSQEIGWLTSAIALRLIGNLWTATATRGPNHGDFRCQGADL